MRSGDRRFVLVVGVLVLLAAAPFWRTHLLPFQDYPQTLVLARAFGDLRDPSTPFYGTYERGTYGPLLLPILVLRAIGAVAGLEAAGRVMWTLYAVGLPLAAIYLLRVLGRDRWTVVLLFPFVLSYWVVGGFFAFATAAPMIVLGLAFAVRWLSTSEDRAAARFVAVACALFFWHALAFAQLVFAFGFLWALVRYDDWRDRAAGLVPVIPPIALFATWFWFAVLRRSGPSSRPPEWTPFFQNAAHFFDYVGPILPETVGASVLLALLFAAGALARVRRARSTGFHVDNPMGWLALVTALLYFVLPTTCLGVDGIGNRQPWLAALLLVFGYGLPAGRAQRAVLLAAVGSASAVLLVALGRRFAAFDVESGGASRLIDRLHPGDTLLAPVSEGSTPSFPSPAKPLVAVQLYATIRYGGLPDTCFAGYDVNMVRYANGKNPMPEIGMEWRWHLEELRRFDYVLLRGPEALYPPPGLAPVATDGEWRLFGVCGSRSRPACK